MLCFAANSLLCRLALAPHTIDPASFTTIRVASATLVLALILMIRGMGRPKVSFSNWPSTAALLGYLLFFSFAYARLNAGTGALLLFGAVQLTMFAVALWHGERLPMLSWAALAVAVAGLVYLVLPGVAAPDALGAIMMAVSGAAWGIFTLLARRFPNAVQANADNFLACLPVAVVINLLSASQVHVSDTGLALAVASGALASGVGYLIWYAALQNLARTHAATVQLVVPAIAALGGAVLLSEPVTIRLVVASIAVLGGVAVVLTRKQPAPRISGRTAS
ncbi:MAG: DMT family transporter [Xanthobacteraceae bacterium]|nr:DMT family transporter [Xanthobacteraceae bacterium]